MEVNTNMKLERWHRQIKYEEAGGVVIKRLDKAINIICKAVKKKLLGRLISLERGKLTKRVQVIRKRHAESLIMDETIYTAVDINDEFIVSKNEGELITTYEIRKGDLQCHCTTECTDCGICIHTLSCTCIDYNIHFIICKHIHFACKKFKFTKECNDGNLSNCSYTEEGDLVIDDSEIANEEKYVILKQLHKKRKLDLNHKRNTIEEYLKDISNIVKVSVSFEDLTYVEDHLKSNRM